MGWNSTAVEDVHAIAEAVFDYYTKDKSLLKADLFIILCFTMASVG